MASRLRSSWRRRSSTLSSHISWLALTLCSYGAGCQVQVTSSDSRSKAGVLSGTRIGPGSAPSLARSAGTGFGHQPLTLATWNLQWLANEPGTGVVRRSEADYARLRRYARRLNADVIAIQEVQGESAAARVFDDSEYAIHLAEGGGRQRVGFAVRRSVRFVPMPDYEALGEHRLRPAADVEVHWGAARLRLLSVHLKSGCFEAALQGPSRHCRRLAEQLPHLEAWIDARAGSGEAFAVMGDFNRRFFKPPLEPFWEELDDSDPPLADLDSPTRGQTSACWRKKHPHFIDHIVLGQTAWQWGVAGSFSQLSFADADEPHRRRLSDHCPISFTLMPR